MRRPRRHHLLHILVRMPPSACAAPRLVRKRPHPRREWAFWGVSIPVACFGFNAATGHWPDFSNADDQAKLGAEAFAFVNVARFAVPLRIGLALSTTPWVQSNIVDKFQKDK